MKNYVIFLLAIFFAGCASTPPATTPAPAPVEEPGSPAEVEQPAIPAPAPGEGEHVLYPKCASGAWCYDSLVQGRVTNRMIGVDPGIYCPKYKSLPNKVAAWGAIAKAITRAECGWKPASSMVEKFVDHYTGKLAVSAGMFQLSVGDRAIYKEYPDCVKLNPTTLLDPVINLKCGMGILDKIGGSRATFREGAGRYWSVVRDNKNPTDGISLVETVKKYYPPCF